MGELGILLNPALDANQTFADGYFVGEEVPTGTTPRTERIWSTHLAFGIAYRIALH
jgi:hypothetical protein